MANYKVRLYVSIAGHVDVTVNAENEDEAIDKAEDTYDPSEMFIDFEEITDGDVLTIVHNDGEVEL